DPEIIEMADIINSIENTVAETQINTTDASSQDRWQGEEMEQIAPESPADQLDENVTTGDLDTTTKEEEQQEILADTNIEAEAEIAAISREEMPTEIAAAGDISEPVAQATPLNSEEDAEVVPVIEQTETVQIEAEKVE